LQGQVGHGGKQQQQPGMVARQAGAGGPGRKWGGLDRVQAGRAAAAALVAAGQPGNPSAWRICQTVWAETGRPSAVSALAISVTLWSWARSRKTLVRSSPVALRGPLGPGLVWANSCSLPERSRVAI
jgi:hypothetical protein